MVRSGVFFVALGVGVAGEVEPDAGPALAVAGAGEESVDEALVGVGGMVGEEGVDLVGGWREAGEVEGDAPDEGVPVGAGGGAEALGLEAGEDEAVEVALAPGLVLHIGERVAEDGLEGPVVFPRGAGVDPAPEEVDLLGGEVLARVGRGHVVVGVGGGDAPPDFAGVPVAGGDGRAACVEERAEAVRGVQSEVGLAGGGVWAVAEVAVVGEDGSDVGGEVDGGGVGWLCRGGFVGE